VGRFLGARPWARRDSPRRAPPRQERARLVVVTAAVRHKTFDELYAEIRQLPEGSRGEILEPGKLHVMGRPGKRHRRSAQALHIDLGGADQGTGGTGWWIELEPEVRFGERLFDPDLAGWRVERVPELPEENPIAVRPDWVCEVLSPSTAVSDVRVKLPVYAAAGVPFVWLVDPEIALVQVFAPEGGRPLLVATASDEERVRLPPFDLDLDPRRWWLPRSP
jgi:Uma2 family endonuclease